MSKHSNTNAIIVGVGFAALMSYRPFRIFLTIVIAVLLGMFCWDKFISEYTMKPNQFSFDSYDIQQVKTDDIPAGQNSGFNQQFQVTWTIRNKTQDFMQTFQLNEDLYLCEDPNFPTDSCMFITRDTQRKAVDLPAGQKTGAKEIITFTKGTSMPGYLRVQLSAQDAVGDRDRTE